MRTLQRGFVCFALALGLAGCGGGDGDAASAGSAPVITAQPQSVTISSSGVTTLRVAATGSGALSYQWRRGGAAISGATFSSYTTSTAGSYAVVVSNAYGSVTSNTATVTVHDDAGTPGNAWNIHTGSHAPDLADTSGWLPLSIALDTLEVSSASPRLSVNRASSSMATVSVDGMAAITLTRDSYGLTIRNQLSGDTHVAFNLSGAGVTPLTVYSANDYKLALSGAAIASGDGPALNLQSKQTAFIELTGINTLTDSATWSARTRDDGSAMDLKATLFAEGPVVFSGSGSLAISATPRHALASDAHVRLRSGTLTLTAAAKDGLRAAQAFVMDGGQLGITAPAGKGIRVKGKESNAVGNTPALGFVAINDGALSVTSRDKGMTASWKSSDGKTADTADDPDPRVTINGGAVTITTTGAPRENANAAGGKDALSPKGIEARSALTVNGGSVTVNATGDAFKAGSAVTVSGGRVYVASSKASAVDSSGALTISGGYMVAIGASATESALNASRGAFTVTGGVFVGIGGGNSTPAADAAAQNIISARNVSAGLWTLRDASGNAVFSYHAPKPAQALLASSPLIVTGGSYSAVTGGALGSAGEDFHGLAISPTTHTGGTAGRSVTISGRLTAM